MAESRASPVEKVAIIGLALQLPHGVNDADSLFEFCKQARCATAAIPKSRFNSEGFYHPVRPKPGHFNVKGGAFLEEDVAAFDAPFFNISEEEAKAMDPQHRLLLECTFKALENAGLTLEAVAQTARVGVFIGGSSSDYESRVAKDQYTVSQYSAIGTAPTMFANRISYFLNLHGPSMTVDTACSSSLTALHLAVESIRRHECDFALVGGAFLQLSPMILAHMANLG